MQATMKNERSKQGIINEIANIQKHIQIEQEHINTGYRLGTFHNPNKRIKEYSLNLIKLQNQLTTF